MLQKMLQNPEILQITNNAAKKNAPSAALGDQDWEYNMGLFCFMNCPSY